MRPLFKIIIPVISILIFVYSCSKKATDEDVIKDLISRAAESASAKDVPGFMKAVSKDYHDNEGRGYKDIKGILLYRLMSAGKISVFVRGADIEVNGDKAAAVVRAVVVNGKDIKSFKDIVPEDADALRFDIVFVKETGEWKAVDASWQSVGLAGLL